MGRLGADEGDEGEEESKELVYDYQLAGIPVGHHTAVLVRKTSRCGGNKSIFTQVIIWGRFPSNDIRQWLARSNWRVVESTPSLMHPLSLSLAFRHITRDPRDDPRPSTPTSFPSIPPLHRLHFDADIGAGAGDEAPTTAPQATHQSHIVCTGFTSST